MENIAFFNSTIKTLVKVGPIFSLIIIIHREKIGPTLTTIKLQNLSN